MWDALTILAVSLLVGYTCYVLGYRQAWRDSPMWYVRPHTPDTLARVQQPEPIDPEELRVAEGRFVRSNLPGGGSQMDRD